MMESLMCYDKMGLLWRIRERAELSGCAFIMGQCDWMVL